MHGERHVVILDKTFQLCFICIIFVFKNTEVEIHPIIGILLKVNIVVAQGLHGPNESYVGPLFSLINHRLKNSDAIRIQSVLVVGIRGHVVAVPALILRVPRQSAPISNIVLLVEIWVLTIPIQPIL